MFQLDVQLFILSNFKSYVVRLNKQLHSSGIAVHKWHIRSQNVGEIVESNRNKETATNINCPFRYYSLPRIDDRPGWSRQDRPLRGLLMVVVAPLARSWCLISDGRYHEGRRKCSLSSFGFSSRWRNIFILPLDMPRRRADVRPYERHIHTFSLIICAGPARQRRTFPVGTSRPQRRHSYFAGTSRDRTKRARNKSSVTIHSSIRPSVRTSVRRPGSSSFYTQKEYRVTRGHAHVRPRAQTCIYIYMYINILYKYMYTYILNMWV